MTRPQLSRLIDSTHHGSRQLKRLKTTPRTRISATWRRIRTFVKGLDLPHPAKGIVHWFLFLFEKSHPAD
jgi:hypothetical protein